MIGNEEEGEGETPYSSGGVDGDRENGESYPLK